MKILNGDFKKNLCLILCLCPFIITGQTTLVIPEKVIYRDSTLLVNFYINEPLEIIQNGVMYIEMDEGLEVIQSGISQFNFVSAEYDVEKNIKVYLLKTTPGTVLNNDIPLYSFFVKTFLCPENEIALSINPAKSFLVNSNNDTTFLDGNGKIKVMCPKQEVIMIDTTVCAGTAVDHILILNDTIIQVNIFDQCNCMSLNELNVTTYPKPKFIVSQEVLDCEEEAVLLKVLMEQGSLVDIPIVWENGVQNSELIVFGSGTTSFEATYGEDCSLTKETTYDLAMDTSIYLDTIRLSNKSYALEVKSSRQQEFLSVSWNTGAIGSKIEISKSGTYLAVVVDSAGCIQTLSVEITLNDSYHVFIPNAFSPNGDYTNDTWNLYCEPEINKLISLQLYDRWGNEIHSLYDIYLQTNNILWDGKKNLRFVEIGEYIYFLILEDKEGGRLNLNGTVLLTLKN